MKGVVPEYRSGVWNNAIDRLHADVAIRAEEIIDSFRETVSPHNIGLSEGKISPRFDEAREQIRHRLKSEFKTKNPDIDFVVDRVWDLLQ